MPKKYGTQSARKLVDELREHLKSELGYTIETVRTYAAPWDGLIWFSEQNGVVEYTPEFGERFLREYYGIPEKPCPLISATRKNINKYIRAIRMVSDFYATGTVSRLTNLPEYRWRSAFGEVFARFIRNLEDIGTRYGTKMALQYGIAKFDRYLAGSGLKALVDISPDLIHEYILSLGNHKASSISNLLLALKKFFAFIYADGHIESDMSSKVPRPKMLADYGVPGVFTREEINRVMSAVNRKTAMGKRDYAMLIIGADLGLRQCDILNLEPSDFDWDNNTVSFAQSKTGKTVSLPLPEKVGLAVIDYLKNGRPGTKSKKLFVMHRSPYAQFANAWYVIDKYMERAGIEDLDKRRHGFHSLRHSLAGALLDEQTPLPVISEILGHVNTNTTSRYLKIDTPNLRGCGLEVDL